MLWIDFTGEINNLDVIPKTKIKIQGIVPFLTKRNSIIISLVINRNGHHHRITDKIYSLIWLLKYQHEDL